MTQTRYRSSAAFHEAVGTKPGTYRVSGGMWRGLQVRNVEPQLGGRFGVATGDVLLEINGRAVESKAQAVNQVQKDYERGVRSFATKWLSNGQIVERTYQAPEK